MTKNRPFNIEIISAWFLALLFSVLVTSNLIFGFNLALYGLTAVIGLLVTLVWPRSGLLAMFFLTLVFAKQFSLSNVIINQEEYKFYLIDIFLLAVYFRVVLDWLKINRPAIKGVDWLLIAFMIWTALSYAVSVAYGDAITPVAFSSLKNYIFYPALYFAVWFLFRSRDDWRQLFNFFIAGVVVSLGFLVYGLVTGVGLWTELTPLTTSGARLIDFDHAFYLALAIIVALPIIIYGHSRYKQVLAWLVPLFLLGVLGSLMRHLWLALLVYLAWFIYSIGNQRRIFKYWLTRYLALGTIILSLLAFVVAVIPQSSLSNQANVQRGYLVTRAMSFFDSEDSSFAWRSSLWRGVWSELAVNPLFGLGLGQRIYLDMGSYKDYVELRNIHNSFLAITTQLGLVGIILLATLVLNLFIRVWRISLSDHYLQMKKLILLGVLVFCSVAFLFQPYLEANWFSIWWWLALGLSRSLYENSTS